MISLLWIFLTLCLAGANDTFAQSPENACSDSAEAQKLTPCKISVFIHGISHAHFTILSPFSVWFDNLKGSSWYERATLYARGTEANYQHLCMLSQGLVDITDALTEQPTTLCRKAAYHIIKTTQEIERSLYKVDDEMPTHRWYTFGWSGLFSARHRREAARNLYEALRTMQEELAQEGLTPRFTLYAYSHGGVIALLMHDFAQPDDEEAITIEHLILSGTPLYQELAPAICNSKLFRKITSFYSTSDWVQTVDPLAPAQIYQKLHDAIDSADDDQIIDIDRTGRIDVSVTINGHPLCNHHAFFNCSNWQPPRPHRSRRSRKTLQKDPHHQTYLVLSRISPFPLMVLFPLFIQLTETLQLATTHTHFNADLSLHNEKLIATCEGASDTCQLIATCVVPETILNSSIRRIEQDYGTKNIGNIGGIGRSLKIAVASLIWSPQ